MFFAFISVFFPEFFPEFILITTSPRAAMANSLQVFSRSLCLAVFIVAGLTAPVSAAVVTWDGETDTDALTGTNWVGDASPSPSNSVRFDDASLLNQAVLRAGDSVVWTAAENSARLTINGNATVIDLFNNAGQLFLGSGGSLVTGNFTNTATGTVSSAFSSMLTSDFRNEGILSLTEGGELKTGAMNFTGSSQFSLRLQAFTSALALRASSVALAGLLRIDASAVTIVDGDLLTFNLFSSSGEITGAFDSFSFDDWASGYTFSAGVIQRDSLNVYQARFTRNVDGPNEVPEPSTLLLLLSAMLMVVLTRSLEGRRQNAGYSAG